MTSRVEMIHKMKSVSNRNSGIKKKSLNDLILQPAKTPAVSSGFIIITCPILENGVCDMGKEYDKVGLSVLNLISLKV